MWAGLALLQDVEHWKMIKTQELFAQPVTPHFTATGVLLRPALTARRPAPLLEPRAVLRHLGALRAGRVLPTGCRLLAPVRRAPS
jgi:hypothetical protein